jgi:predicted permease
MRTGAALERLGREIRHAARRLLRNPMFTLATVMTLALAIGANVAIFAVVERVLLNPLPYPDSDRLIALDYGWPSRNMPSGISTITSQLYYQYADRAHTLAAMALHKNDELTLTGNGNPERVRVSRVTPSLGSVLRVTPERGRWFTNEEGDPGALPVAVLSHGLWVRRFGQDPAILGRRLTLNGVPATVIAVMPPSFLFPDPRIDLWMAAPLSRATASDSYEFSGVARLRDGVTIANARDELTAVTTELEPAHRGNGYDKLVSTALSLRDATVGRIAAALWILLASVGLVLLVACANVANLFLVRSEARQREIAVRRALGAGNGGIAGYFLSESALLSIAGGAVGLALAWGGIQLLVALGPTNLPRLEEVRLGVVALGFTFALSLLTAVAFGSIPLLRMTPLAFSLHESGRGNTASRGRHRVRHLLMAGQIALALVLLVSSGLMLRSFQKLRAVDPGFDATSVLTFRLGLPRSDYPDRGTIVAAHQAILERLSAIPGVTAVSASTCLPLSEQGLCFGGAFFVEGRAVPEGSQPPVVAARGVASDYFNAMGMRLVRGRGIDRRDIERSERIVVVNEALVRIAFPGEDPLGKRVRLPTSHADACARRTDTAAQDLHAHVDLPRAGGWTAPPRRDELRGPHFVRTARLDRRRARGDRTDQSEPGGRSGAHASGHPRPRVGADGVHDGPDRNRRDYRTDARRHRHLRRHGLHRQSAHG